MNFFYLALATVAAAVSLTSAILGVQSSRANKGGQSGVAGKDNTHSAAREHRGSTVASVGL